jgi:hypothetical protein
MPKILIAVISCVDYGYRRRAVRRTWLRRLPDNVQAKFFVGGSGVVDLDAVSLPVNDGYHHLTQKTQNAFRYALRNYEFDFLMKCCDDTYVVARRLNLLPLAKFDCFGSSIYMRSRGYYSGGAGYLLSRELVQTVADWDNLAPNFAEDKVITRRLIRDGARAFSSPNFRMDSHRFPDPKNRLVTAHYCKPWIMAAIDRRFPKPQSTVDAN